MPAYEKKKWVTCKYCGKEYLAPSSRSKYGCPNYDCNVAAAVDKLDYHNDRMKKVWRRKSKKKAGSIAKS